MILPLFSRELTEYSARRRTYTTRAMFGFVLYAVFLVTVTRTIEKAGGAGNSFAVLGTGRELFSKLVEYLCWSVLLFQPALMAGKLTYEKERESLSLLLLTGMSPGKILVEKFLSGLLPMVSLLLLALPLGAITMSYGGVSLQLLLAGVAVVAAACLHFGAISILCSAWCRTTTGAIIAAYAASGVVQYAPVLAASVVRWFAGEHAEMPAWAYTIWPPAAFERILESQSLPRDMLSITWQHCRFVISSAAIFLLLGRVCIERRAMAPVGGRRVARAVAVNVGRIARWWRRFWPPRRDIPGDEPVTWRESGRGVLGGRGRFARLTIALSLASLVLCVALYWIHPQFSGPPRIQILAMIIGAAMVLTLATRSVGSLLDERTNQTLDILLTTRLGAAEIVQEKVDALTRYRVLFWLLLAITFAAQGLSEFHHVRANMTVQALAQFWFCGTIGATVYPTLIIWLSMLIALTTQSKTRAVVIAITIIAAWFIGPLVILHFTYDNWRMSATGRWLSLISPLGILDANASGRLAFFATESLSSGRQVTVSGSPGAPVAYNFTFYAAISVALRCICLRFAERWLRSTPRHSSAGR